MPEAIKPYGAADQLKAAQNFPQPEFRSNIPDIRMSAEPAKDDAARDQSKDVMDFLRSQTGRIQTSELLKLSESLSGALRTIQNGTTIMAANAEEAELWGADLTGNETKFMTVVAELATLDPKTDADKIKDIKTQNSDLMDQRRAYYEIKAYEEKLAKEKEAIPEQYSNSMDQMLDAVDDLYDVGINQKKNLAPYDHRTAIGTVKTVLATSAFVRKSAVRERTKMEETVERLKQVTPPTPEEVAANERMIKVYEHQISEVREVEMWTQRTERDSKYLEGFVEVTVGQSASLPVYYDVVRQLMELNDGYRTQITADGLENMFSKAMPGLDFDPAQQATIKKSKIGLEISEKDYGKGDKKPGLLGEGGLEVLGLKELGTHLQDDSFESRMKAAAISQCDFSVGKTYKESVKTSFMGENLNEDDYTFYKEVFGVVVTNKKGEKTFKVLAPHVATRAREIKLADARLEAILVTNAVRRMEEISATTYASPAEKTAAIKALAKEVVDAASARLKRWKSRGDTDMVNRMAVLVTRQGLLQDYSFMHGYRYCWKYEWNCDENGNPQKIKGVEIAGVLSRSGDLPSLYFYRRDLDYDKGSKSRTPWMLPSSEGGRIEASSMPYDRMPKVYKLVPVMENGIPKLDDAGNPIMRFQFNQDELTYLPKIDPATKQPMKDAKGRIIFEFRVVEKDLRTGLIDDFLREQLNFLLEDTPEAQAARKEAGYEFGFSKTVADKFKEWAIRWRTPFSTKFVGPDNDVKRNQDVNIVVPAFFPGLPIANFFEAITDGDGKLNIGGPDGKSVWAKLIESQAKGAKKMRVSDVRFNTQDEDETKVEEINGVEDQPVNRWLIDQAMAANYMNLMINVFDKERDNFNNLVTGSPATLGPKDFIKKMVLTFRDAENSFPEEYEISLIPFFITLSCANKYGIMAADAWKLSTQEQVQKVRATKVEAFLTEMALWKRAFKWLSSDRPSDAFRFEKGDAAKGDKVDDAGYLLDADNKRIQVWKYGENMALVAEFYEGVLLRMAKSSAEESIMMTTQNYEKTAKRINKMSFMGKGNLNSKINENVVII